MFPVIMYFIINYNEFFNFVATPASAVRLLQTSKFSRTSKFGKNVTVVARQLQIFRASEGSPLSRGVGPNAGDQEYPQRFIVAEEDVLGSIHITVHHCSTVSTLVHFRSTKIPLDVSATTAGLAGVPDSI